MNKKGQFYLLTAIILSTVLWASLPSRGQQTIVRSTFDSLRENFISESPNVINYAIANDENLSSTYLDFVERFLAFSETRQVEFGVIYIIRTQDGIEVGNFIGEDMEVEVYGVVTPHAQGSVASYPAAGSLTIHLDGTPYAYGFDEEPVQFKALFRQLS